MEEHTRRRDHTLRDAVSQIEANIHQRQPLKVVIQASVRALQLVSCADRVVFLQLATTNSLELVADSNQTKLGDTFHPQTFLLAATNEFSMRLHASFNNRSPQISEFDQPNELLSQHLMSIPLTTDQDVFGVFFLLNTHCKFSICLIDRLWPIQAILNDYLHARAPFHAHSAEQREAHLLLDQLWLTRSLGLVEVDANDTITRVNPLLEQLFDQSNKALLGQPLTLLLAKESTSYCLANQLSLEQLIQRHGSRVQTVAINRSGAPLTIELRKFQYYLLDQKRSLWIIEPSTPSVNSQQQLQSSKAKQNRITCNLAPVGILQTNADWEATYFNDRWCEICQWDSHDLCHQDWISAFYHEDLPNTFARLKAALTAGHEFATESRIQTPRGNVIWVELTARPLFGSDHSLDGCIATLTNCTYRKNTENKLRLLTERDSLTNLPNRVLFLERVSQMLLNSESIDQFALLCLDLDGFKTINDSLGHAAGDRLLVKAAKRLKSCIRDCDIITRLGGDEFSILLKSIPSTHFATYISDCILEAMRQPFELYSQEIFITTSIGITFTTAVEGTCSSLLLKQADLALYKAKALGRDLYHPFSPELERLTYERLLVGNDLHRAIKRNEFEVYYQLQADLHTGAITGSEALLRWQHPSKGILKPIEFMSILEETGRISVVNEWLWYQAFAQHKHWMEHGLLSTLSHVSINLAPCQIKQPNFFKKLMSAIQQTKLEPKHVLVEITETVLIEDFSQAMDILNTLRWAGVKIALDDFGTGYSSLTYLKQLPIDIVKIDQTFVKDLLNDKQAAAITRAVIDLAHTLDLNVIAEGVDDEEKRERLASWNCNQYQGYLLNKPCPSGALEQCLKGYNAGAIK